MMLRGLPKTYAPLILHVDKKSVNLTPHMLKPQLVLEKQCLGLHAGASEIREKPKNGPKDVDQAKALQTKDDGKQRSFAVFGLSKRRWRWLIVRRSR